MKKVTFIILFFSSFLGFSSFSREAKAQYYGGYGYYFQPNSFNCFTGCGKSAQVAAWTSVGLAAVDAAVGVHMYSKQLELQTNQNIYQIEQAKSQANINQTLQDYQNIMAVAPFFDDTPTKPVPQNPSYKHYPTVAPLQPHKIEATDTQQ